MPSKFVLQKSEASASYKSVKKACQVKVYCKTVKKPERPTTVSSKSVPIECQISLSSQNVPQEWCTVKKSGRPTTVSSKSAPKERQPVKPEYPTRVWLNSAKSVCQVRASVKKCDKHAPLNFHYKSLRAPSKKECKIMGNMVFSAHRFYRGPWVSQEV